MNIILYYVLPGFCSGLLFFRFFHIENKISCIYSFLNLIHCLGNLDVAVIIGMYVVIYIYVCVKQQSSRCMCECECVLVYMYGCSFV